MYVYRDIPFEVIWRFGWKNILRFIGYGTFICFLHAFLITKGIHIHIPFSLIGPIGVAVAIYAGFKNSQSYDRTWEARKNWGSLAGATRIFANHLNIYLNTEGKKDIAVLVNRQIAVLQAHKLQLRKRNKHSRQFDASTKKYYFGEPSEHDWQQEVAARLLDGEYDQVNNKNNRALQLLYKQLEHIHRLFMEKKLDEYKYVEVVNNLQTCIETMGKNDRIKTTPFPRQYAFFSTWFIIIFILILPFGILDLYKEPTLFVYVAVCLIYTLVSWLYSTMELVGNHSEDPFEHFITDIPMSAIIRTVEIDLFELFDLQPKPDKTQAVNGILM